VVLAGAEQRGHTGGLLRKETGASGEGSSSVRVSCVLSLAAQPTLSPTSVGSPNYSDQSLIEITIRPLFDLAHQCHMTSKPSIDKRLTPCNELLFLSAGFENALAQKLGTLRAPAAPGVAASFLPVVSVLLAFPLDTYLTMRRETNKLEACMPCTQSLTSRPSPQHTGSQHHLHRG
jgi:hypothetical protein